MQKIAVGSLNPVKLAAAKELNAYNTFSFETVDAKSDVPDQPMGWEETMQGAINRAKNSLKLVPDADYGVGIEGGCRKDNDILWCFAAVAIMDRNGKIGRSTTGEFVLPDKIRELVLAGKEVGEADDIVFNRTNSKQKEGTIGVLTKGFATRASHNKGAVLTAFIPFINPELYE